MRKLIRKSAGWIHATLIIAIIIPLLYSMGAEPMDSIGQNLYIRCLIILLPIVASDFAVEKCKGFLSYFITSIVIFAITGMISWSFSVSLNSNMMSWAYQIMILCETVFVIIDRFAERLNKYKETKLSQGEDPNWHPYHAVLREPSFMVLIYFVVIYTIALNLNSPSVCNAALFSAIMYSLITLLYQYVCETETYLSLNKRTCNLPSKRIYGIGNGMLAIFLMLFLLTLLPSLFTVSNRHYRDLRNWFTDMETNYPDPEENNHTAENTEDPMAALIAEYGEPKPTPQWLIYLTYAMEFIVFLILAIILLKKIFASFHDFRKAIDENGDVVEELHETKETPLPIKKSAPINRRLSERERIRKKYRKAIRRHRKDRPAIYESPREIEVNAGIAGNEEYIKLHEDYELARYGRES
ncbi:MAG: hypothetical protein K2L82_01890 [Lachnospiraceae bacterium]|nr:hypothetical protein [Lachnospiraceae bacterium]